MELIKKKKRSTLIRNLGLALAVIAFWGVIYSLDLPIFKYLFNGDRGTLQSNHFPMYGNKVKSEEEKVADKDYLETMMDTYDGDTIKAARVAARDGWHYFYQKVMDKAMFRFNQSWLIDSTYPASYFGFAAINEYYGYNDEAEVFFDMAYKHDHTDSLTKIYLHQIAEIMEKQKDTECLLKAYYRVLARFADDGVATGKLGFFYDQLHKHDSALKYYNITTELHPEIEQSYVNRGWLFLKQGKTTDAIADFTTAIAKNDRYIHAYANRGNALMINKQFSLAIADIDRCIELDPEYPDFHTAKAECYHQLKRDKEACEEIEKGIKKGGDYKDKRKEYNCN